MGSGDTKSARRWQTCTRGTRLMLEMRETADETGAKSTLLLSDFTTAAGGCIFDGPRWVGDDSMRPVRANGRRDDIFLFFCSIRLREPSYEQDFHVPVLQFRKYSSNWIVSTVRTGRHVHIIDRYG